MANTAHALHILVKHQDKAEDILQQIKKAQNFKPAQRNIPCALPLKKEGI